METSGFIHRFEKGRPEERPLVLLHGTGGDENDLIPLARMITPTAPLLSPRGKVLENGKPRFFRRLAEGVFDEDDVRRRANELADFVTNARALWHRLADRAGLFQWRKYRGGCAPSTAIGACRCNPAASNAAFGPPQSRQAGWRAGFDSIRCARSHYTARLCCETGVIARALWRHGGTSSLPRRTRPLSSGRYARAKVVEYTEARRDQ